MTVTNGQRYGKWTVVGDACFPRPYRNKRGPAYFLCKCECGTERLVCGPSLLNGISQCCGCEGRKKTIQRSTKHGFATRKNTEALHIVWLAIKQRCYQSTCKSYKNYGGKGIAMCEEWKNSYAAFREWCMSNGYRQDLQIDRIDNNRGYYPDNCRWVTRHDNMRNRSDNLWVTAWGETKCYIDWTRDERCKVSAFCLYRRLSRGIHPEIAMSCTKILRKIPA